ncbi:MAG: hypothetical protein JSS11_14905 [Verrucomicrobia bacterium]|nr:hypothetical protein [Verrucomicrobiota bacterium]
MKMIDASLHWLAAEPGRYWTSCWITFAIATALAFVPEFGSGRTWARRLSHPLWFALAVLLVFAAFRWPSWYFPRDFNPDEPQMIAGAVTLREYPVFWRDVDGTTHGPLTDYILLLGPIFGLPLNLIGCRIIATLLAAGSLLATWWAGRRLLDPTSARLAILPAVLLWASTFTFDFLQYSSEVLPIFLTAVGGALGVLGVTSSGPRSRRLALVAAGLALGSVPYSKLQGVPLAALVGLLLIVAVFRTSGGRARWADLGWLIGCALVPTMVVAAALAIFGLGAEFYQSYWLNNLFYASGRWMSYVDQIKALPAYLDMAPGSRPFFFGSLWAVLLLLIPAVWGNRRLMLAVGWAVGLAGFYTVLAPGRTFQHYIQFLITPAAFLLAVSLHGARRGLDRWSPWGWRGLLPIAMALALWPGISDRVKTSGQQLLNEYLHEQDQRVSEIGRHLLAEARPGDRLAMWGWRAMLYVETGLPQAIRDAQTYRAIENYPMRDYYRARYMADFQRAKPRWFVDAVGGDNFIYHDRQAAGHETFPELQAEISQHYMLVGDWSGCRLYQRR